MFAHMEEIWKTHPRIPNYEFSNMGNFKNSTTGQILKKTIDNSNGGYVMTFLPYIYDDGSVKRRRARIHLIVAQLFVHNPDPETRLTVNHKDGVKTNNLYTNLEWMSNNDNIQDAIRTGLRKRSPAQKLNEEEVKKCREIYETTDVSTSTLAKMFKVCEHSICSLLKYETFFNVEPDKKFTYRINTLQGEERIAFFNTKKPKFYQSKKILAKISVENFSEKAPDILKVDFSGKDNLLKTA